MSRLSRLSLLVLLLGCLTVGAIGQRMMRMNANDVVMLREIGVVVAEQEGKLRVMVVMPRQGAQATEADHSAAEGDAVGMVNGKRVKSLKEFRAAYGSSKPGETFKVGFVRNEHPFIVTFERKDEKDMPQGGRMVIQRAEGDENEDFFPALGFGLKKEKSGVLVTQTLPHAPKELKTGDQITSLNGTKIENVADFNKTLDGIKVGDEMTIDAVRNGQAMTISMKRPEPQGQRRVMRREE